MAAIPRQRVTLLGGFHPFGNHIQFQVAGHADDGLHDHIVGLFHAQVVHERLVDLELVERQAREVCQR